MDVDADHLEAGPLRHVGEQQPRVADWHAELVAAHPGGDVRMAPGVDVGVHPQRHPGAAALADRLGVDALQLAARFGVDGLEAEGDRPRDLGGALADAGEDDLVRRKPALRATSISPTELQSALAPRPWIRRTRPSVEFALRA